MRLHVPILENGIEKSIEEIVYTINEIDFNYCKNVEIVRKNKKISYLNVIATFDIEATTINAEEPYSYMYHWQFCIDNKVVFGRTWEEFEKLINKLIEQLNLCQQRTLVIYVHNLSYEFQFIKDFLQIEGIFAKDKRKVMKMNTIGMEWRCSYFLSNMSLLKFCENSKKCIHYKLKDTYDYRKIRTPNSNMTEEELAYCYNDVRGLSECVETLLEEDDLASIPLTNTGYVRRDFRKACNNKEWHEMFTKIALTEEQYILCRKAFRGGDTHANKDLSYMILSNCWSYDKQSSYPAAMMLEEYPIGKFIFVKPKSRQELDFLMHKYVCIIDITIFFPRLENDCMPYIDIAHCYERSNIVNDNGRVLSADMVSICCTNIDFEIILATYGYENFLINKMMVAQKGLLPKSFRNELMIYYRAKTELKGIAEKEYEYMKSKNRANSSFGMMVTDIAHSEIVYKDGEWSEQKPDISAALEEYYKNRNNFLPYQWGVFVTAHARKALYEGRKITQNDTIYQDTDSVKFRYICKYLDKFKELNNKIIEKCEASDPPAYAVKNGKKYYLGVWDFDGYYKRFITLGAKKYAYEDRNKKLHITVSGMSKKAGPRAVKKIENFKIGKTFTNIGRTVAYYNESHPHKITVNGDTFTTASNIAIVDTTYTLGITNEYAEILAENAKNLLTLSQYDAIL